MNLLLKLENISNLSILWRSNKSHSKFRNAALPSEMTLAISSLCPRRIYKNPTFQCACSLFHFVTLPLEKEAINHASARTKHRDLHKIICQEFIQLGNKSHLATQLQSHEVWKAAGACIQKFPPSHATFIVPNRTPRHTKKETNSFLQPIYIPAMRRAQQRGNDNKNNFSSLPSAGCVAHVPAAFRSQPTTPRYLFFLQQQ